MLGQNRRRNSVQPRKDSAHEQHCACGRRDAKVSHVSSEEKGKTAFATVDANELTQRIHLKLVLFCDFVNDL